MPTRVPAGHRELRSAVPPGVGRRPRCRGGKGLPPYGRVGLKPLPAGVPVVSEPLLIESDVVLNHAGRTGRSDARNLSRPLQCRMIAAASGCARLRRRRNGSGRAVLAGQSRRRPVAAGVQQASKPHQADRGAATSYVGSSPRSGGPRPTPLAHEDSALPFDDLIRPLVLPRIPGNVIDDDAQDPHRRESDAAVGTRDPTSMRHLDCPLFVRASRACPAMRRRLRDCS
jgi:hypothetical protein